MPGKFAREAQPLRSPVRSTGRTIPTHEGGVGYERYAQSELYLLAVTNLVGQGTFYERPEVRDGRFADLIHRVTREDYSWVALFVPYLRDTMQMRSASIVMAAEYVKAGGPNGRAVINAALMRADEPAEMLAYWINRYGRNLPAAVKRGVADAAVRLYDEYSLLKYDTPGPWRFGNVILLTHAFEHIKPASAWKKELFLQAIARHNNESRPIPVEGDAALPMVAARQRLSVVPSAVRKEYAFNELREAGMTWEAYSAWLEGPMDAAAWMNVIPFLPYMATLRNLRNFEEAEVPSDVLEGVARKLADPEAVAKSRQFPLRFLSAWKATQSMTFGPALEKAIQLSVSNVPPLPGRTLILIDCSGSMFPGSGYSGYYAGGGGQHVPGTAARFETAGLFGSALALRAESANLYAYGSTLLGIPFNKSASALRITNSLENLGGTETWAAVRSAYDGHDRVVILTDEQAFRDDGSFPTVPIYTFNVAGYRPGHAPSGASSSPRAAGRHVFGGLTDAAFRMLPLLEAGRDAGWPWLGTPAL